MQFKIISSVLAAATSLAISNVAFAAVKTYQVTGPVLAVDETSVTVEKGKEKWTLVREAATKKTGDEPKVGDKVTITYKMVATEVETKAAATTEKKK